MMQLSSLAVILTALSGEISAGEAAIGPKAVFPIVNRNISPDGYNRSASLADGTFPGPLIVGKKYHDSTFSIEVQDKLKDSSMDSVTSIHWHGLFQKHTNYADGAAFVTQCPIVPSESFTYAFDVEDQTGTYWYHSHYRAQYCDGVRGPLVIYDPKDPHLHLYDVDDESTVITLADWYHYVSARAPLVPEFNSTLINGKGRYAGGPRVPLARVNVSRGKRYRLRLVSISCDPAYTFSIDFHTLTVIEVDGINVKPWKVDSLQIFAGQRYSVVLRANRLIGGNFWIRALPNFPGQNYAGGTNVAILHYKDTLLNEPISPPDSFIPPSFRLLKETDLHPLVHMPVPGRPFPGGADININLDVKFRPDIPKPVFYVNNHTFNYEGVPMLLQILSGAQKASDLMPKGSIYGLEAQKSVEISIPAGALGGPHPIHLHGHAFHVVRSAGSSSYNYVDTVVRDVVSIGDVLAGDNVTIRFFTDNPGPWFLHCHIDWHLERGFAVVFAEDVPKVETEDVITSDWEKLCPAYDQFVKGTPVKGE